MGKSLLLKDSPQSMAKEAFFNSTTLINEYSSPREKKKITLNLFERMKPIVQSLKNHQKAKKVKTKDNSTTMNEYYTFKPEEEKVQDSNSHQNTENNQNNKK